ncbi:MAG TPA: thioredoxin family protein, partial [Phycisphaerae bacterium]|nr:thioredoxin family protein [Phycisphaerae bacterium]
RYPKPHLKPTEWGQGVVEIPVYSGKVIFFAVLRAPADAEQGGDYKIVLKPQGQICRDVCVYIPVLPAAVNVKVGAENIANPAWPADMDRLFADSFVTTQLHQATPAAGEEFRISGRSDYTLWGAVWLAFLAGLLLNVMPCVLPVLPLRILSVVQMAGGSRRRYVTLGVAFAGGVLAFFACIAALNIVLRLAVGRAVDLNEGYQSPAVIGGLCAILVILAMNLFGVFEVFVPARVAAVENRLQGATAGHAKSFGLGYMMAVLGTPCSFAFLAAAVAYAQTASILNGTLVILAVGAGMAMPHFILAAMPKLIDLLPKPGRWMELFRQGCGFAVLGATAWLISTLASCENHLAFRLLGWLVILCVGCWVWGRFVRYDAGWAEKLTLRVAAVAVVVLAGLWLLPERQPATAHARPFDVAAIENARQEGRTVVVKFSARWCIKCMELEREVFENPDVVKKLNDDKNIVFFEGDITTSDMPAAVWMREHGFGSRVPLTVIYRSDSSPQAVVGGYSPQEFLKWIAGE